MASAISKMAFSLRPSQRIGFQEFQPMAGVSPRPLFSADAAGRSSVVITASKNLAKPSTQQIRKAAVPAFVTVSQAALRTSVRKHSTRCAHDRVRCKSQPFYRLSSR